MALSRSDPTAFEERRRRVIEEAIARAPHHRHPPVARPAMAHRHGA
ncbi:DUF3135 domain-containing protein [Sulfuricella denitrificans]